MSWEYIIVVIIEVICFVIALTFHEVSHGFVAYKLGDPTAKRSGRLTLNPLKHIDPFGTVILPGILMLMNMPVFGYAKPVPYNPSYFKNPRVGDVIVGFAGPLSNFCLALLASIIAWILYVPAINGGWVYNDFFYYFYLLFLPYFVLINLFLMFFNLIPIPPLDGSSIFAILIPVKYLPAYYKIQRYAFPIFLILVIVVPYVFNVNPFSWYLGVTAGNLANLIYPFSIW
ncbi:MAG: site-2 protease family protein [Eggerthellaceae bacterium]|nr:site-2 protease family protein [Eggerthellaceae bacterium]